ncbi:hypothetical protein, partial [Serratia rubidaea]|uniref:hypothetical protein n=1 Tax=Serratia rubidaea TaxID=61652 RepID=UPI00243184DE
KSPVHQHGAFCFVCWQVFCSSMTCDKGAIARLNAACGGPAGARLEEPSKVGHCQASNKVKSLMRKHEAFCVWSEK